MANRPTLAIATTLAFLFASIAFSGPIALKKNMAAEAPGTPAIAPQLANNLRTTCPDIRVIARQRQRSDGSIQVTIKVVNTSSADFVSAPDQQALVVNGNGRNVIVPFPNLVRGGEVVFHDTFHPFEFPATYNANISFDPDIFVDGNPQNDDCRASNNHTSLTTAR